MGLPGAVYGEVARRGMERKTYVPGELGIRHEDTVAVTADGCENLAPRWSGSPRSRRWCEARST
jgi:Xaa-Pro aminopeptidase